MCWKSRGFVMIVFAAIRGAGRDVEMAASDCGHLISRAHVVCLVRNEADHAFNCNNYFQSAGGLLWSCNQTLLELSVHLRYHKRLNIRSCDKPRDVQTRIIYNYSESFLPGLIMANLPVKLS